MRPTSRFAERSYLITDWDEPSEPAPIAAEQGGERIWWFVVGAFAAFALFMLATLIVGSLAR